MATILHIALFTLFFSPLCLSLPQILNHPKRTENGFHLPLHKREVPRLDRRDGGLSGSSGLGDYQDITYNIMFNVGDIETPLVLDTGSSDLWVISDACKGSSCASNVSLYPQARFHSSGLDLKLFYGDSLTGTHASGEIGNDTAGVAGISIEQQPFGAINDTNTTVVQTGSAGIFGLGFPLNSVIWSELFKAQFPNDPSPPVKRSDLSRTQFPDLKSLLSGRATGKRTVRHLPYVPDFRRTRFPDLGSLLPSRLTSRTSKRQSTPPTPSLTDLLNTFATNGPLLSRLAAQGVLASPQFTITLQRDTVQVGGNVGMLSLGELPPGVTNDSLTWVPVRGYTAAQGGLDSTTDTYPIAWEVPIDDVFVDGQKLPLSTLAPGVSLTVLIDSGNSLIRGPQDVVQALTTIVMGSRSATTYDCSVPHTLSFQIGGKQFPVDPRDFVAQTQEGGVKDCTFNVVGTDPPHKGFLYSWSLGDPFLKSNLASFYFGNLTHPSVDPPRIGFMSTVQSNASEQLQAAVSSAGANGGSFVAIIESAPASNPSAATTVSALPLPQETGNAVTTNTGNSGPKKSGTQASIVMSWTLLASFALAVSLWLR